MELVCSFSFLKHPTLSNIIIKGEKKKKKRKSPLSAHVKCPTPINAHRIQFLLCLLQVHGSEQNTLCISLHRHKNPTTFLFLFFSPFSMLLFQPRWATELSGNHHAFASAREAQRPPYKSSSDSQGTQTTCWSDWNLRITSSSKRCFWHFFETTAVL